MSSSSLAIVEKKPPFAGGGGCAGGVLFHLLDWHRRLARKRRLLSPRRLLPSSVRGYSPRRLPPPPSPAPPPPRPPPHGATTRADGNAAPGVVARLMGLESWPAAASWPQKQRKVVAASAAGDNESSVLPVLPPSQRPPAPPPAHASRSHHSADLPARSPRRSRLVRAAAAKLLQPGARESSRGSARPALAYACSSPQHRKDAIAGHMLDDDFLSRSGSLSLEGPASPAGTERRRSPWRQNQFPVDTISSSSADADVVISISNTEVAPRSHFDDANTSRCSSDVDPRPRDHRARTEEPGNCDSIRSNNVRIGEDRRTVSSTDVSRSVGYVSVVSSTDLSGRDDHMMLPGGNRRSARSCYGPRRESMGSIASRRITRRDATERSGLASRSRNTSNGSGLRRGSHKKADHGTLSSRREDRDAVAISTSSSAMPLSRAMPHSKVSEKSGFRSAQSDTDRARMAVVHAKCLEAEPSAVATSEKEEFSRLLKAKISELGLSERIEPSDCHSGNLTVSVLQELISALTNDTNTSTSHNSMYSDSLAPLSNAEFIYNSNDQSPDFQRCYQDELGADSSTTCTNDEAKANQPSPTSVLEACFSNDTSSLGSPNEKIEGKEFLVSIENKMEDLFNLESDIVDLSMSMDTTKTDDLTRGETSCVQNFAAHDFKLLEARLHSIGEAVSNAELLIGTPSILPLSSFIIEMLETVDGLCGTSESLGLTEEKKYRRTNFLFDCIIESLNSKFRDFGKCGYKAWLRLPLTLSKDLLKREISKEIISWREPSKIVSNQVSEKDLDQLTAMPDPCQVEAFDISMAIEDDILAALVDEFAFDQW